MKIVCDDKIPFLRGVFEPYAEVAYLPGAAISEADVRDADALLTRTRTRCNASLLSGSSVRVIASATIGFDHIDTSWCEAHGIAWANAPGCNAGSVAQYVESALLTLAQMHGFSLAERTLGIVGVGHVGSRVARIALALGMRVMLCDPPRAAALASEGNSPSDFCDLATILRDADIITLHVPLAPDTFHMFDAGCLSSMRSDQILINTSRGPVVDNAALRDLLAARRDVLAGRVGADTHNCPEFSAPAVGVHSSCEHFQGGPGAAVLDVWENEPDIDRELLRLVDIGTPHIAGYSADGKANGTTAAVRFVASRLGIKPLQDWSVKLPVATGNDLMAHTAALEPELPAVMHLPVMPDRAGQLPRPYDILRDSAALRAGLSATPGAPIAVPGTTEESLPHLFERLRETYPLRRE